MLVDMNPRKGLAKTILRSLADLLWPPRSLISGARGLGKGPLSASEFSALHFITDPVCDRCGRPLPYDAGAGAPCAPCLARPPRWSRARAALVYDDLSRRPVLDLKRSGRRDGLVTLAGWMLMAGRDLVATADILVPVPLHYTRLVTRGFNQSAWLALAVADAAGARVSVDALKRTRRTPSQAGLTSRARRRNVSGAFAVRPARKRLVTGKRVLLIDDVLTTGATLSACTRALKQAGAADVSVLVLARVVREQDVTI